MVFGEYDSYNGHNSGCGSFYRSITGLVFLIALAAAAVCLAMYIYINAPLNRLVRRVSSVNIGGTRVSEAAEISRPSFGIAETEMEINRMVDYIEELSAQALKQRDIEQNLRYEMLRAQLNPHFLFNTLNIIKWSAMMSGAANIADMITSLGILLENTMNRGEKETALREEIKVVKAWLRLKTGVENRIQIYCEIPDDLLDFRVISFFTAFSRKRSITWDEWTGKWRNTNSGRERRYGSMCICS